MAAGSTNIIKIISIMTFPNRGKRAVFKGKRSANDRLGRKKCNLSSDGLLFYVVFCMVES